MNQRRPLPAGCARLDYAFTPEHPIEGRYRVADPAERPAYNMHYEVELGIVVRGRLRCDYRERALTLGPGAVWFSGIWEPHRMYVVRAPCTLALLLASPDMAVPLQPAGRGPRFWLSPFLAPLAERPQTSRRRRSDLLGVAERIGQALAGPADVRDVWLQVCLTEALLWAMEDWHPQPGTDHSHAKPGELTPAISQVFQTTRFVTTTEAAQACGLSRNLFSRRFGEVFRMSFSDFALRYRLRGAADDLLHRELPIKAVADKWGFRDVSHFHRAFVHHFACRPAVYREQHGLPPPPAAAPQACRMRRPWPAAAGCRRPAPRRC